MQLSAQGQLTKWWSCVYMDLPWETLLAMPQQLLLFHLNTTYNKLPSPSNLCHYHINPKAPSLHCRKKVCTTVHVLGTCTVALQQGHFIFCHYSVLRVLVAALKSFLPSNKCNNAQSNIYTKLIKAGAKLKIYKKALCWTDTPYCWFEVITSCRWQVSFPFFFCYNSLEAWHGIVLYFH